jgi:phosphomannomutase
MDHAFHENGCVYYRGDELMIRDVLEDFIAPDTLNDFIRFLLRDIADVCGSPWLTGTFIERRSCMLNVSPIGRSCTQHQREDFFEWDQRTKCRQQFVERIKSAYPDLPFDIAVGGQISVDIFPCGFNKTRCIQHLDLSQYKSIHFIGDQVHKGGNDHELFMDPRVIGHKTSGVEDTQRIIAQIIDGC